MKKILAPVLLLFLSFAAYSQYAKVTDDKADLYATPCIKGKVKEVLLQGMVVTVVRQKGPWFLVRELGRLGWVHGNAITLVHTKEMRLDRMTKIGSGDRDTGATVKQVGTDWMRMSPDRPAQKQISGGVLNGKATSLPKPAYPAAAMAVHAGGAVSVQVLIDETGRVISANAVSGHPLLRASAVSAAQGARFSPTLLMGQPVKVSGVITYNFVP